MSHRGEVIAAGRDTEIVDWGPGVVLRRPRRLRSMAGEAEVMRWVRSRGYPCPEVLDVVPEGLVMARIEGRSMLDDLLARPTGLRRHATLLADLHAWLHRLDAPDGLPTPFGPGRVLLHGDLHPGNVLLTDAGPVVIDWTNAAAGPGGADVALAWLLMAAAAPPDTGRVDRLLVAGFRRLLVRQFLRAGDRAAAAASLRAVLEHQRADPNIQPAELAAMEQIVDRYQPD